MSTAYATSSSPVNLLGNSNMEAGSTWSSASWDDANTFTTTYTTSERYFGKQSLKINSTAYQNHSSGRVYQDLSTSVLVPGKTYTLSGYIKTTGVTNEDENT